MAYVAGIDLGCTKFIVGVAREDGELLATVRGDTRASAGPVQALDRMVDAVREACGDAEVDPDALTAVGIGSPGPLVRETGTILSPPQLPWGEFAVGPELAARLGDIPWIIDNDCKVGGIGELRYGAATGARSMVYFGVGTGIGGCIVVDGQVQYGESDNASEIGHLVVWMGGPECGCGSEGCLEGIASGSGIERRARTAVAAGEQTSILELAGGDPQAITGAHVTAAAADGDAVASRIWREAQLALGAATASVMNALSPEYVVIGGGIAKRHGAPYVEAIEREARRRAIGPNADHSRIVPAQLGELSVLRGAVGLALDRAREPAAT